MGTEVADWSPDQLEAAYHQRRARANRAYRWVTGFGMTVIALTGLELAIVTALTVTVGAPLWTGHTLMASIVVGWALWLVSYHRLVSVTEDAEELALLTFSRRSKEGSS